MNLTTIVTFISEIGVLAGVAIPAFMWIHKLTDGMKCQLRSEMLRIYYHNRDINKALAEINNAIIALGGTI